MHGLNPGRRMRVRYRRAIRTDGTRTCNVQCNERKKNTFITLWPMPQLRRLRQATDPLIGIRNISAYSPRCDTLASIF